MHAATLNVQWLINAKNAYFAFRERARSCSISTVLLLLVSFMIQSTEAQTKPTLRVATYESFVTEWGPGPKLKKAFERQCNCSLEFSTATEGVALLNQIKLKGEHFKADLVLGLDESLISEATATGFFQPHNLSLPPLANDMLWKPNPHFVPFDRGYFAFIYNRKKLKNPPTSFKELLTHPNINVVYPDPRLSTVGRGLLYWMNSIQEQETAGAWQSLAKRTLTVTPGWSESYGLLLEGEADMALSYHTSPAYHQIIEKKSDYAAALFKEGHYAQVEIVGIRHNTPQAALAKTFIQFLLTPESQKIIALNNWMKPVIDVQTHPVLDQLPTPKGLPSFEPDTISKQKKSWVNEWLMNSRR